MSASLAVHATLVLLALVACLMLAFISLRQVFRLIAAHSARPSEPLRPTLTLRPVDDVMEDEDALVRPLASVEPSVSRVN